MKPIDALRDLIEKNEIEAVFVELAERFENNPIKRDLLISIKNQHNQLEHDNTKGVITYENASLGRNKVINKLLKLIAKERDIEVNKESNRNNNSTKFFKYIFKSVNPLIVSSIFKAALIVLILSIGVYALCVLVTNGSLQSQISLSDWVKQIEPHISKTLRFSFASVLLIGTVKYRIFNIQFLLSLGECCLLIAAFYFSCLVIPLIFENSNFLHLIFLTVLLLYGIYRLAGFLSYYLKNKSYGDSLIELGILIFFVYELSMNYKMFI